jgi:uncharacterized protein YqeY
MLVEKLRSQRMLAAKENNKVKRSILTTLLGECENLAKRNGDEINDDLIIKLSKKFINSNNESIAVKADDKLVKENAILEEYLPKQLSESEIRDAITDSNQTSMGGIMGYLNKLHKGKFDGKLANKIAREFI